jgi:N-acylglucosamine 2-epimerase
MHLAEKERLIAEWRGLYRSTLLENVIPFWMKHGRDTEYGGIGNILDDAGNVLGHDKYVWSQGRALWTFSALCSRIERRPEWLAFADHIYQYLAAHGRDDQGRWMYRLDPAGNVLDADISISADGFALNGLGEYFRATGKDEALALAIATYENTWRRIRTPGSYGIAPYTIPPGLKAHGVAMTFSFFYYELGSIAGRPDICETGLRLALEILEDFYVPEKDAVLEYVSLDGKFVDSPQGRTCVPGHAIEGMWFLISIFERAGRADLIPTCCRLIRRHLGLAWDEEHGGLRLALAIDGKAPIYWRQAEIKPWWVQVEALVATAYAYAHTREDWCLEWHRRVQEWAFSHYPVSGTGEWTQWLDREGRKTASAALPVKDPFHLPRALIYLIELMGRAAARL